SNTENDMYNPDGEPMSESTRLPLEEESFDVICMFSVFTHIAPHDYVEMLRLLRRYIKPDGRIFFSLFINEATEGGHGFVDKMSAGIAPSLSEDDLKVGLKGPADFLDWYPERPLWRAVYSREKAINLIADTGWEIESLNDPLVDIQHYMICKPI
ncbi:MAG: SAM-dependent methyltransferase, partial [Halioglobus sp.]